MTMECWRLAVNRSDVKSPFRPPPTANSPQSVDFIPDAYKRLSGRALSKNDLMVCVTNRTILTSSFMVADDHWKRLDFAAWNMIAIKTKFDGHSIEVPAELHGAQAGEVVIVYAAASPSSRQNRSIWDYFGQSSTFRTAREIEQQVQEERQSWNEP